MRLRFFEAAANFFLDMKIDDAMTDALHGVHLHEHDCDYLAQLMEAKSREMGIRYERKTIVAEPPGSDLGHMNLQRQSAHVVLDINGKVFDPYFRIPLPMEEYLKRVYAPERGVELVVRDG